MLWRKEAEALRRRLRLEGGWAGGRVTRGGVSQRRPEGTVEGAAERPVGKSREALEVGSVPSRGRLSLGERPLGDCAPS